MTRTTTQNGSKLTLEEIKEAYTAETTADHRNTSDARKGGDGVYQHDHDRDAEDWNSELAALVTKANGRIPVDFREHIQNEGYARTRTWSVYAHPMNRYRVAADIRDLFRDKPEVEDVSVELATETGKRMGDRLARKIERETREREDVDQEVIDRAVEDIRWERGLPREMIRDLRDPPNAREIIEENTEDTDSLKQDVMNVSRHPADAWEYHEIYISVYETADEPFLA